MIRSNRMSDLWPESECLPDRFCIYSPNSIDRAASLLSEVDGNISRTSIFSNSLPYTGWLKCERLPYHLRTTEWRDVKFVFSKKGNVTVLPKDEEKPDMSQKLDEEIADIQEEETTVLKQNIQEEETTVRKQKIPITSDDGRVPIKKHKISVI